MDNTIKVLEMIKTYLPTIFEEEVIDQAIADRKAIQSAEMVLGEAMIANFEENNFEAGYNRMHNIAKPIVAKLLLENKELKCKLKNVKDVL